MKNFGFIAWGILISIFMFNMHPMLLIVCAVIGLIAGLIQRYVNESEKKRLIKEEEYKCLKDQRDLLAYHISLHEIQINYNKSLGYDADLYEKWVKEEKEELKKIEEQMSLY